jgi:hypothetical protein
MAGQEGPTTDIQGMRDPREAFDAHFGARSTTGFGSMSAAEAILSSKA